jgi:hypothetical protein
VTKQLPFETNCDQGGVDLHSGKGAGGEFFAPDRRALDAACRLGLNPLVAYLTITRGAGSRRTSRWSVDAIERHTGMSRSKAKSAIKSLIEGGLLALAAGGTRPLYEIAAPHELAEFRLSPDDRIVFELFDGLNQARIAQRHISTAVDLAYRGILIDKGNRWFSKKHLDVLSEEPQPVWLPNAIVDGASGEAPPLALLRQMQEVSCVQLFVTLYDCSDLPTEGGVSRQFLYERYQLTKISERGACTIWRFSEGDKQRLATNMSPLSAPFLTGKKDKDSGTIDFWRALAKLEACGLLAFVPHVFESELPEGEILHAYPLREAGEVWERGVAVAADVAARSLLDPKQLKWAIENDKYFFPIPSHINPAVLGVARLRYRPRTRKTAAWLAQSKERSELWQRQYETISQNADPPLQSSVLRFESR